MLHPRKRPDESSAARTFLREETRSVAHRAAGERDERRPPTRTTTGTMNESDFDPPATRRIGGLTEDQVREVLRRARPIPTGTGKPQTPAVDIVGTDPTGAGLAVRVRGSLAPEWTLLVFLSTSCAGCADLWALVSAGIPGGSAAGESSPAAAEVVAVTRGPGAEDPSAVARLCPSRGKVVMSDDAWGTYRVSGAPFFVVVHRAARTIVREGVAWGPDNVLDQLGNARRQLV